ncbi:MAG: N-6 DNA methylase [Bacteroidetes bacterium]|nr:N-6 DNA methylase [Bacteroidota bacterium]
MSIPPTVIDLVERFERNIESYKFGNYNEQQTRYEFINPFFEALGWDVSNKQGYAEAYKDVVHEYSQKTADTTEAPDYLFRIGGTRKFFVEAKKPSVKLADDTYPAYQLRRYAWTAKLPLSILTDFEEFAVYDCRIKPNKNDKPSFARVNYYNYKDYVEKWEEIASVFSKDSVLKGSFDKYAEINKAKRGTAEVDDAFLKEIEHWRDILAKNIAIRNPKLTNRELNFAVQKTIDRIIFLRICEDRGIEDYGQLMSLQNGVNVYIRMMQIFNRADEKYNSGLFHFEDEKGRIEPPDIITPKLTIDDKTLKDIIKNLYYPESPYEFSVLPADILGHVYEQFLGKVIRLTPSHQAKIDEKPEVKKAGGVYYTPTYIVDYIVKNTVGKLLEDKTPNQIVKLRILDPACGSGSFLLGAYQYLLDWHLQYYTANPTQPSPLPKLVPTCREGRAREGLLYQTSNDEWKLTTAERKRILLNNIYGVDIDPQAVEVTKLSLLLKVLEGETDETLASQMRFFHERALPDLSNNIKCGNSLIGPDFYDQTKLPFIDDEERIRINVFDWNEEFKDVMSGGGFDVVIGNPPYGFHQIHDEFLKPYFKKKYYSSGGSFEHYFLFYEASLNLLKENGTHGYIVPVTWLTIPSAKSLRKYVLDKYAIEKICWLPEFVFKNAKVNTLITIISNTKIQNISVDIYDTLGFKTTPILSHNFSKDSFIKLNYYISIFSNSYEIHLIDKIQNVSKNLKEYARPCSGYNPYEVGKGVDLNGRPHTKDTILTKPYHSGKKLNKDWKPEIVGRDLSRYFVKVTGKRWIKYGSWLAAARDPNNFKGKRILVQEITGGKDRRIIATFYEGELYHSRDIIPIKLESEIPHPFFILAILNSRLISWFHLKRNPKAQKGLFPKVLVSDLEKIPIRIIKSINEKSVHDKIVILVKQIIDSREKESAANTPIEKDTFHRQITAIDNQIDKLVYELYGLTEEEIKIVEGNVK